jgi:hypothetical protein
MSPTILKSLESQTRRDLAATAKSHGIAGWHGMRKQELVKAIAKIKLAKSKSKPKATTTTPKSPPAEATRPASVPAFPSQSASSQTPSEHQARIQKLLKSNGHTSLSDKMHPTSESVETKLNAQVKDSHWLLANWTITQGSLDRAKAALGAYCYQAVPVIRVYDITTN